MILRRYLQLETLRGTTACGTLLVAIYAAMTAVRYLKNAAAGEIAGDVIAAMLLMKLATGSLVIVPLCLFLGILLAYGRLRQDREIVAMTAAGCGRRFFYDQIGTLVIAYAWRRPQSKRRPLY